jgi:hypothetical protein
MTTNTESTLRINAAATKILEKGWKKDAWVALDSPLAHRHFPEVTRLNFRELSELKRYLPAIEKARAELSAEEFAQQYPIEL